jgi:hypothetical protein
VLHLPWALSQRGKRVYTTLLLSCLAVITLLTQVVAAGPEMKSVGANGGSRKAPDDSMQNAVLKFSGPLAGPCRGKVPGLLAAAAAQ